MDARLKECKRAIRLFLRTAYSDERLVWLLAHARSGSLSYRSCCCLVGVATADHALQGKALPTALAPWLAPSGSHYAFAKTFLGANEAERAYYHMGYVGKSGFFSSRDAERRRRLIPLVRAEMRRRERQRDAEEAPASIRRHTKLHVYA